MDIDPQTLGHRERYLLMGSAVGPRPIALVSTLSAAGTRNLAPFSLFNLVCYHPVPVIVFTPMRRYGEKKDTLRNIETTQEFVVNLVTEEIVEKMNVTAGNYPPEEDEFRLAGFTPAPSACVKVPRVAESPLNLECRLIQIFPFGKTEPTGEMVMGEVLRVHVPDGFVRNGIIDLAALHVVGKMGYDLYVRTRDCFRIPPSETSEYHPDKKR